MKSLRVVPLLFALAACGAAASGGAAASNGGTVAQLRSDGGTESNDESARDGSTAGPVVSDGAAAVAAPTPEAATPTPAPLVASACNEQGPQDFLVRRNYLRDGRAGLPRAIQYRTDEYGSFESFGHPKKGTKPASAFVVPTTFMGLPVRMHEKVVPALKCVEQAIRQTCTDHPYTPRALAGIRFRNTYAGGEVTNHAYGIAIDIDPDLNTCCGCVGKWKEHPACKRPSRSEYDRMAMPECWVHAFESFGFYWLGHDALHDTMHFEFLGDPDRIAKGAAASVDGGEPDAGEASGGE